MKKNESASLIGCKLFARLSSEETEKIVNEYASYYSCKKNNIIFSETKYKRAIVIILSGSASVTKNTDNAKILMNILSKGDIFGMAALFHEEDFFLTEITALEPVTMLVIEKESLLKIFSEYPVVAENYITILSEKIHFLNKKINTYTKSESIGKVASMILQYADSEQKISVLPYSITRTADALNTGRASVYRAFDALEKSGAIRRVGKKIEIIDAEQLKNF